MLQKIHPTLLHCHLKHLHHPLPLTIECIPCVQNGPTLSMKDPPSPATTNNVQHSAPSHIPSMKVYKSFSGNSMNPMNNNRWEYYPSLPGFACPSDLQMTEAFLYAYWQNSSMMTKLKPSHVHWDAGRIEQSQARDTFCTYQHTILQATT